MNSKFPSRTTAVATFILFAAIIWLQRYLIIDTLMRRQERTLLATYADHGPYNNMECTTYPQGKACEDVKIHYPTNTAFLACGSPEDRMEFYPSAGWHNFSTERHYLEYLIKYDFATNVTTRLEIENWDPTRDLVLHGLDIWRSDDDKSQIYLFAVNHDRRGDTIVLFSHPVGTNSVRVVAEYQNPLIKTANEVTAAGPRAFFVSNDHYFTAGMARHLEDTYGPFSWASSVVYCEDLESGLNCRTVSIRNSHPYANGILLLDQGRTLAVADVVYGSVTFYDVHDKTKELTLKRTIPLGASPDNISEMDGSGDLIVAVVPNMASVFTRVFGDDRLNHDIHVEAAVLRLVKAKGFEPELLYWDDGSLISILTGAAVDATQKKLIAGGVWERHFVVCNIDRSPVE